MKTRRRTRIPNTPAATRCPATRLRRGPCTQSIVNRVSAAARSASAIRRKPASAWRSEIGPPPSRACRAMPTKPKPHIRAPGRRTAVLLTALDATRPGVFVELKQPVRARIQAAAICGAGIPVVMAWGVISGWQLGAAQYAALALCVVVAGVVGFRLSGWPCQSNASWRAYLPRN
jgi:hypothetical protein